MKINERLLVYHIKLNLEHPYSKICCYCRYFNDEYLGEGAFCMLFLRKLQEDEENGNYYRCVDCYESIREE